MLPRRGWRLHETQAASLYGCKVHTRRSEHSCLECRVWCCIGKFSGNARAHTLSGDGCETCSARAATPKSASIDVNGAAKMRGNLA